jgi:hypothetical protein
MKAKLLITSLFVSCALYSFAQAQENEPKSFNQDIGFNTTFILQGVFNASNTPFSLMYKKYTDEKKALRFGVSVAFEMRDANDKVSNAETHNLLTYNIRFSVGKEFQKHLTPKWTWFSGGDIVPSYSFSEDQTYQGATKIYTYRNSSLGLGLRPFLGIRYNFNSRLYLSAEASLLVRYSRDTDYSAYDPSHTVIRDVRENKASISLSPASGLFLYYRF